jgi:hypothetical protein
MNMEHFEKAELSNVLKDKSDFPNKTESSKLPSMLFDIYNCDLFDSVRPIHWVDP